MDIITIKVGELRTNCYLVYSEKTMEAMIVDPGDEAEKIPAAIKKAKLKPVFIVNTHFHPDHLRANEELAGEFELSCMIGEKEGEFIETWRTGIAMFSGFDLSKIEFNGFLKENDTISVGELSFKIMETPGHSPGGICLYGEGVIFTGDTLFDGDVGRFDLPGGSKEDTFSSFKKLMALPENTKVYPGHGPFTTIKDERKHNVLSSRA